MVTRCFGWGLPDTCMVPFADCINHANVDSSYELICTELHRLLIQCEKDNLEKYASKVEDLKTKASDEKKDDDDNNETYYTMSKAMFNCSDLLEEANNDVQLTNRSLYIIRKHQIRQETKTALETGKL